MQAQHAILIACLLTLGCRLQADEEYNPTDTDKLRKELVMLREERFGALARPKTQEGSVFQVYLSIQSHLIKPDDAAHLTLTIQNNSNSDYMLENSGAWKPSLHFRTNLLKAAQETRPTRRLELNASQFVIKKTLRSHDSVSFEIELKIDRKLAKNWLGSDETVEVSAVFPENNTLLVSDWMILKIYPTETQTEDSELIQKTATEAEKQISLLSSEDFSVRNAASQRLAELGTLAISTLTAAIKNSTDLEVSARCKIALKNIETTSGIDAVGASEVPPPALTVTSPKPGEVIHLKY